MAKTTPAVHTCPDCGFQASTAQGLGAHLHYKHEKRRTHCDVDGCEKPHHCKGFCDRHYWRFRRYGDPLATPKPKPPKPPKPLCEVQGCDRVSDSRGMCGKHYKRWLRHGDPNIRLRKETPPGEPQPKTYSPLRYRDCVTCGSLFVVPSKENNRRYCSDQCNICSVDGCQRKIEGKGLCRLHHSQSCRDPVVCDECGTTFRPTHDRGARYCSFACHCQAKTKPPEHHRAMNATRRAIRRARVREGGYERVDPHDVYERDGWRCGICGKKVRKELRYPHPRSVSLDHIVPVSLGGLHNRSNVQCSHLDCNLRKSNRGVDQLLLFG